MLTIRITRDYRVDCSCTIELPAPAGAVWKQLVPWRKAATWDPFHRRIVELDGEDRVGGQIVIDHQYGPVCLARTGRLLRLHPEQGFAFSDLSLRNEKKGFPHTYSYDLASPLDGGTRLTVRVRGRWTLRIGRPLVHLWLWWVMIQLDLKLRSNLGRALDDAEDRRRCRAGPTDSAQMKAKPAREAARAPIF